MVWCWSRDRYVYWYLFWWYGRGGLGWGELGGGGLGRSKLGWGRVFDVRGRFVFGGSRREFGNFLFGWGYFSIY